MVPWIVVLLVCVGWTAIAQGRPETGTSGCPNEAGLTQSGDGGGVQGHLPTRPLVVRDLPTTGYHRVELSWVRLAWIDQSEIPAIRVRTSELGSRAPPLE
ncbi:hypothetical protein [Haloferula sargassicola]|uniref:Uncharacterized protein n=1 Tax=Haloferula sargassicola TaxID=490096 RepID=A0ABP9URJ5_9BACT